MIFYRRPVALRFHLVFWSAQALFGLAMLAFMLFSGEADGMVRWLGSVLALFVVSYGVAFTIYVVRELRADGPAVVIGPEGLHDRRISVAPIPWDDIRRVAAVRMKSFNVMFDIDPRAEERSGIRVGARVRARINKALGLPAYDILGLGTDVSVPALTEAIGRFKPVEGQSP